MASQSLHRGLPQWNRDKGKELLPFLFSRRDACSNISSASFSVIIYGWIGEQARSIESCILTGYPSGQGGTIQPARDLPRWTRSTSSRPLKRSKELGQYRAIVTLLFVNNAYIYIVPDVTQRLSNMVVCRREVKCPALGFLQDVNNKTTGK